MNQEIFNKNVLTRLKNLEATILGNDEKESEAVNPQHPARLNFDLNERTFVKTYARDFSGPKKFVLLLSHVAKGKVGVEIELKTIRAKWNKMTAQNLMRYKFNLKYPNEAKTQGWIDSKKVGIYHLRSNWMEIFD